MSKKVAVIGGGIAGMEASAYLSSIGYNVTLFEKENVLGGHLLQWKQLFPSRRLGKEVVSFLSNGVRDQKIRVILNADITKIDRENTKFRIRLSNENINIDADAILLTTGYDLFDARKKEEYGYGIYTDVITSAELEDLFMKGGEIRTPSGKIPKRVGFIHCVGSRDEKVGNTYCSKVCCATGVKQAVEIKEHIPDADVYCFYMDLRMFERYFEDLYLEAQQKWGINFIRGRLSEAAENADGTILVKVEDTLAGKPLKMSLDLMVLLVGFVPSSGTKKIGQMLNVEFDLDGFIKTKDEHTGTNLSTVEGIFLAGTCTGPGTIVNTLTDARAAAYKVVSYLENFEIENRDKK